MYWEDEIPQVAKGDRSMLIMFPKAKKLQVALIWEGANNPRQQGKTVTLSEEDMTEEMVAVLRNFLDAL